MASGEFTRKFRFVYLGVKVRVCDMVQGSILGFVKALSGTHNRDGAIEADNDLTNHHMPHV